MVSTREGYSGPSLSFTVYFCRPVRIVSHPVPRPCYDPTGPTYHTTRGVQLAVRDAAEVLAASPVVLAAVTHGPKGVQEHLQAVEGGRGHQLLPVGRTAGVGSCHGDPISHSYLANQVLSHSLGQKSNINHTLSLELTNYRHSPYLGTEPRW